MAITTYNSLVQKTFCDNAIRSVVMIDDDFITYSDSIKALNSEMKLDPAKLILQSVLLLSKNIFKPRI